MKFERLENTGENPNIPALDLSAYCLFPKTTKPNDILLRFSFDSAETLSPTDAETQPHFQQNGANRSELVNKREFYPLGVGLLLRAVPAYLTHQLEKLGAADQKTGTNPLRSKTFSRRIFCKRSALTIGSAAIAFSLPSCEKETPTGKLLAMLMDPDVEVRRNAVRELALLNPNQESELVINALAKALGDEDEEVRSIASAGLADRGMAAMPALLGAAVNPAQTVRKGVFDAFVQIGIPSALTLAQTFTNLELPVSARQIAIEAFVRILIDLADRITALREDAQDLIKRESALSDLKEIKTSLHESSMQKTVPFLSLVYKDADRTIHQAAVMAIGILANMDMGIVVTEAIPHLIVALKDADDVVRQNAAGALGAIRDASTAEALTEALSDNAPHVRENAMAALQRLGSIAKSAVPKLIDILSGNDNKMAELAAKVLGAIQDPRAVPHLGKALRKNDHALRVEAASALALMGESAKMALKDLLFALQDQRNDDTIKNNTIAALGRIADPKAVPALTYVLYNDKNVRYNACLALTEIFKAVNDGDLARSAVPALVQALYDNALETRIAAAICLWQIAEYAEGAEQALRDILNKIERGMEWDILNAVLQAILKTKKRKI